MDDEWPVGPERISRFIAGNWREEKSVSIEVIKSQVLKGRVGPSQRQPQEKEMLAIRFQLALA